MLEITAILFALVVGWEARWRCLEKRAQYRLRDTLTSLRDQLQEQAQQLGRAEADRVAQAQRIESIQVDNVMLTEENKNGRRRIAELRSACENADAAIARAGEYTRSLQEANVSMLQHSNMLMDRWVDAYRRLSLKGQQDHDKRFDGQSACFH